MNHLQYYLGKLAEEAAEIAQIALKTSQFGAEEKMPGQPLTNFERCHLELDDLWAMVEELNDRFGFAYAPDPVRLAAKKTKVRRYLDFSIAQGMVDGETVRTEHPMTGNLALQQPNAINQHNRTPSVKQRNQAPASPAPGAFTRPKQTKLQGARNCVYNPLTAQ